MAFQILIILAGLVIGWIKRGSIWNMGNLTLRLWWILPIAYLLQHLSIAYLSGTAYQIMIIVSYALMIAFCSVNVKSSGMIWALTGTIANLVALSANKLRMPAYVPSVKLMAPQLLGPLESGTYGKSIAMTASTHLNFLGDIFAFNVYPQSLLSIGDILFAIGLIIIIQNAMRSSGQGTIANA